MSGICRRLFVTSVAALAATLLASETVAASLPTPASGATWGQNQRVEYRWKEGAEPVAWAKAAMNAAAADSNASRKSKAAVFAQGDSGLAWVAYTDDLPTNWAIGYTVRGIPDWFSIRLRPQGTQLDWGTLRWCQFYDDPPNGCYDAETIMLHEFGHAQTLGHPDEENVDDWLDTVMHATGRSKARVGWNIHAFGRCDVARLQIRYEALTPSTPISTCMELPTDLSLSVSAGSVTTWSSVAFTAKLKIADDSIYPTLASDPLAGRSVVLQRRAAGTTGWTTVADMADVTDTAGRYVKSLSLTATYEWRAMFASPTDEGLDGSSSSVVQVTVTSSGSCQSKSGGTQSQPGFATC